jgi:hypothetical protein
VVNQSLEKFNKDLGAQGTGVKHKSNAALITHTGNEIQPSSFPSTGTNFWGVTLGGITSPPDSSELSPDYIAPLDFGSFGLSALLNGGIFFL